MVLHCGFVTFAFAAATTCCGAVSSKCVAFITDVLLWTESYQDKVVTPIGKVYFAWTMMLTPFRHNEKLAKAEHTCFPRNSIVVVIALPPEPSFLGSV